MSILQRILNKVTGQVSEEFFRSQLLDELGSTNFDDDAADTAGFAPGQLYFYTYSAQTKQPYYDMYPLTYVIEYQTGGFIGCNLHYVPLNRLMDVKRCIKLSQKRIRFASLRSICAKVSRLTNT